MLVVRREVPGLGGQLTGVGDKSDAINVTPTILKF